MKKIFSYVLIFALPFLAASCQKSLEDGTVGKMKGEYYADITGEKPIYEIFPGASKIFDVRAYSHMGIVSDVVNNLTLKAAPEMVSVYNSEHGTSYEMCPGSAFEFIKNEVMMPRYGSSSTTGRVKVVASGLDVSKTYILPISIEEAEEGGMWSVADTLAAYVIFTQVDVDITKGLGTADSPYMIYDVADLKEMGTKFLESSTVYFKLANDIDMTGVDDWYPLNGSPYNKFDFDGAGFTISNFTSGSPLFDGIAGKIHDLNVTNANITNTTSSAVGIIAANLGATGNPGAAERVYVQGTVNNTLSNGTGGLFGIITESKIDACSADVTLNASGKYDVGGIFGYANANCSVTNCWSSGEYLGNRYVGGIGGMFNKSETSVSCCYTTAAVSANFASGGIIGQGNLGDKTNCATNNPLCHVEKCIAWNEIIQSLVTDTSEHYSMGVIVGYTALKNYHVDCYRKADIKFIECPGNASNVIYDQPNSSPESPLTEQSTGTYVFPYHGKAAGAGETASAVAKKLGWDETIWDLSGNLPFFKGANAPVENPDVPSDGQLPDFGDNEFYN